MTTVYLALGANVGDRAKNIEDAILLLSNKVQITKRASIYESRAVGFENQDNFFNTALKGTTELSPAELLTFVKDIENQVGRVDRFHWGPREIDIDILLFGDTPYKDIILEIPHPHMAERDFVLIPLAEIAPSAMHPLLGKTILELANSLPENQKSIVAKTGVK